MSARRSTASFKITVTVLEARGLRMIEHKFGSSTGVFCHVKTKDAKGNSKLKGKTLLSSHPITQTPKWNETIELYPVEVTDELRFVLEDKITMGVSAFLGELRISIADIVQLSRMERWYALSNRPGTRSSELAQGELLVRLAADPLLSIPSNDAVSSGNSAVLDSTVAGNILPQISPRPFHLSLPRPHSPPQQQQQQSNSAHYLTLNDADSTELNRRRVAVTELLFRPPSNPRSSSPDPRRTSVPDALPTPSSAATTTATTTTTTTARSSSNASSRSQSHKRGSRISLDLPSSSSPAVTSGSTIVLNSSSTTSAAAVASNNSNASISAPVQSSATFPPVSPSPFALPALQSGHVSSNGTDPAVVSVPSVANTPSAVTSAVSAASLPPLPLSAAVTGSAVSRPKGAELFRKTFKLPDTENLLVELACSLVKTIPLHGRLYLSDNYMCFYSSLLGIKTCETIPIADIVDVHTSGKDLVIVITRSANFQFSSFRHSRDEAFGVLQRAWRRDLSVPVPPRPPAAPRPLDEVDTDDSLDSYLSASTYEEGFLSGGVSMTELVREEFDVTVLRFFKLFFADGSPFSQLYHDARQDKDLRVEPWTAHPQWGTIRSLKYRAPVRATFGPKETNMTEAQRYNLQKERLIVETTTVLHDIPYGDYFTIEGRWDCSQPQPNRCLLSVSIGLNFSKRTILRSKIESSTVRESKESYEKWVQLAKEQLQQRLRQRNSAGSSVMFASGISTAPDNINGADTASASAKRSNVSLSLATFSSLPSAAPAVSWLHTSLAEFVRRRHLHVTLCLLAVLFFWALLLTIRVTALRSQLASLMHSIEQHRAAP